MSKTPITDMVKNMLASGVAPDVIVSAIEAVELQGRSRSTSLVAVDGTRRGARLSEGWQPSPHDIAYAAGCGLTPDQINLEAERFRNYWIAKTGTGATKRNWGATWKNWILKAVEYGAPSINGKSYRANSAPRRAATGADAVLAGVGRVAGRIVRENSASGPGDRTVARLGSSAGELDLEPDRT